MRRRRPEDRESPRYCHHHQPGAFNRDTAEDQALDRNKQGVCGLEGCQMRIDRRGRVREIKGSNVKDVLKAHREANQGATAQRRGPWLSGSFYLVAIIAIIVAMIGISRLTSPWAVPIVVVGSLFGIGTIGAMQLRHDDRLSEQRFVELVKLTYLNLPSILRKSPPPADPFPTGSSDLEDPNGQSTPPA
ncbi:hypothetical protein [Streptomyces spirodelae]|uniref:DUF3040 domain-containing protein n=1 Tax=Streptomyces spirodelae TaxID=2812904 RepID=A0ABS3X3V4_9ACTN|nr:hypothetical protein [Streptomyces spirodelae]MBO8190049.1 hypothetical protein [Streptomyces spirodelae]